MPQKRKFAVFLDLDGTLYAKEPAVKKNAQAIARARSRGILVFANSGRSVGNIPEIIRQIELDGIIAGIGCHIIYNGQTVYSDPINLVSAANFLDYFTAAGKEIALECEESLAAPKDYGVKNMIVVKNGRDLIENHSDQRVTKVFVGEPLSQKEHEMISRDYLVFEHKTYAEFSNKGNDKATGMQKILDLCGVSKDDTLAVGDSGNDLDMLNFAAVSVAMGNADPKIKDKCNLTCPDANDAGVAWVLDNLEDIFLHHGH